LKIRICKCGCGQIIELSQYHLVKKGIKRNSYYTNKNHLPKSMSGIENWVIEKGYIIEINKEV
jgi:hypothetical protein